MNRLGASTWIWTSPFSDAQLGLVARAKELGFDLLELAVEDPGLVTGDVVREAGEEAGIGFTVCGAFGPDRDLSHEDAAVRRVGIEYVEQLVDLAAAIGAPHVVGPMYSAVGKTRMLEPDEREQQRALAVESIKAVAAYAGERGVRLAIEPLNRFETDLVNTAEQVLELVARVERRQRRRAARHVPHEHRREVARRRHPSRRRPPAPGPHLRERPRHAGHRARAVARRLRCARRHRLHRPLVIESFTPELKEIAKAVSLWRPLDAPSDELARNGARFLRESLTTAAIA